MSDGAWAAALVALFTWWVSTGVLLMVVRRADRGGAQARRRAVAAGLPVLALGLAVMAGTARDAGPAGAYAGFLAALAVWGWVELTFLTGVLTGPDRRPCPPGLTGRARFDRAWGAIAHHEIALLAGLCVTLAATAHGDNRVAAWTYGILFAARISAKLNLFLGVPRINTEFIPDALSHLAGFFRRGPVTPFFAASITALSLGVGCFLHLLMTSATPGEATAFALLGALTALALLEHWLMLIPLPDARLWRWMLPEAIAPDTPAPETRR